MHGELGEDDHPGGRERESDQGDDANAEAGDELTRDRGARGGSCRERPCAVLDLRPGPKTLWTHVGASRELNRGTCRSLTAGLRKRSPCRPIADEVGGRI